MQPWQALFRKYVPRRLQQRGLIERADMKMHFRRALAFTGQGGPASCANPRHLPGDELNFVISPFVTAEASRLYATNTETGAPLCLRQLWQWHHATPIGSPVATNRTAPHRHPPSILCVILLSLSSPKL